jgi:flavin-dependent dehydrogenase
MLSLRCWRRLVERSWCWSGRRCTGIESGARFSSHGCGRGAQAWSSRDADARGGIPHTTFVPYDETVEPAEAEATAVALDKILPGVPGTLGVGHPRACEELSMAAMAAGARVLRGVESAEVQLGLAPTVRYSLDGAGYAARCRLVIGADGRESAVRRRAGITLHATEPRLLMAGLLVEDLRGWPEHHSTIGTEGDLVFFVVPQSAGRARLYLLWAAARPVPPKPTAESPR